MNATSRGSYLPTTTCELEIDEILEKTSICNSYVTQDERHDGFHKRCRCSVGIDTSTFATTPTTASANYLSNINNRH
jgi:hypothetical protein